MNVTIMLCVLSTTAFCLCTRGLIAIASAGKVPVRLENSRFSAGARRVALGYFAFTLVVLGLVSFVGAVRSFFDLFTFQI